MVLSLILIVQLFGYHLFRCLLNLCSLVERWELIKSIWVHVLPLYDQTSSIYTSHKRKGNGWVACFVPASLRGRDGGNRLLHFSKEMWYIYLNIYIWYTFVSYLKMEVYSDCSDEVLGVNAHGNEALQRDSTSFAFLGRLQWWTHLFF